MSELEIVAASFSIIVGLISIIVGLISIFLWSYSYYSYRKEWSDSHKILVTATYEMKNGDIDLEGFITLIKLNKFLYTPGLVLYLNKQDFPIEDDLSIFLNKIETYLSVGKSKWRIKKWKEICKQYI